MSNPLVHVLVINWNGREHLEECFETLLASDYDNARYVLVDNASDDDSVAFVREHFGADDRVEVLALERNLGWSGGNNAGIERVLEAGADYVLLLNNDTAIAPDAISHMVSAAEENASIGALAPKLLLYDNPALLNSIGLEATRVGTAWDRGIGRLDGPKWDAVQQVVGVCGAAFFLRSETLRKTGLLPTDFEIYLDDLDLSLRVWNAGYEVLTCPQARVRHKFSATMGEGKRARHKYYLNTRNRARLILRNYPAGQLFEVLLRYKLSEFRAVGRAILDGELWRLGAHARSWFSALRYLPVAMTERSRRRKSGIATCRFWNFIRPDRSFFPGVDLPEHGWYDLVTIAGKNVRPMSSYAYVDHVGGDLEIVQVNPHPTLSALKVRVEQDGRTLLTLNGKESRVTTLSAPAGRLEFRAQNIFEAEEIGLAYDVGAWLSIRALKNTGKN